MKRGSKRKHLKSEEACSGSSSDSAKKKEVIEDRNESFDDPTSQKQTEAESEDETIERLAHTAATMFVLVDHNLHSRNTRSSPCHTDSMMPSTILDYDDTQHGLYPLNGSANIFRPWQLNTQSVLDKTTSLSQGGQTPASSIEPTSSKAVEHVSARMLDKPRPHEGVHSRPTGIREHPLVGASATHSELPSGLGLHHQPGSIFTQSSSNELSDLLDFCCMFSPSVPRWDQGTNPSSTPGYRRYLTSYQNPVLPEDLSLRSTRQLEPDDTNMEQKRSPLIHHQHPQFSTPTPEFINTETQEEAASGSGSLSVSEGTEPVLYEDAGSDQDLLEADPPILAELLSDTKALPPSSDVQFCSTDSCWSRRTSSSVPGSVSMPSLIHITSAGNNKPTRAASLPDLKLQSSFEEFTPDLSEDHEEHEGYRFQCSCPGLYQCSVTGLVFDMEGEGDVVYRTVPWNRRLLVQHHKKPAGPLFDIKCQQQSVRQLHLPHCQILPTAGSLEVAHVTDDGVEFITPHKITETHLVINIRGFSGYGNAKDKDSPPDPVRALVLLFYRPPDDPDVTSELSVLLLPRNVVIDDVKRTRIEHYKNERLIDVPPHCQLVPDQFYTLSTEPEDDLIKVQPTEAEFDAESYSNYFTSIQVSLKALVRDINLSLKDKNTSCCVWERDVCLLPSRPKTLTLPPEEKLLKIESSFIDRTSGPVLNNLLDKLLEIKVFNNSERESANEMQNRSRKAGFIIDTVRKKGDDASSEMIKILCELDPFLCRDLNLM